MSDILATGTSGLLAFQQALTTISHNISNASTPGYNRQSVNLVTNLAQPTAQGWIGNGVVVAGVARSYDSFLVSQTRGATSSYHQLDTVSGLAGSVSNLFADPSTGLSAGLQKFSESLQTLANGPAQTTSRQAVIGQAQSLVNQFRSLDSNLGQLDGQVAAQLGAEASSISSLATSIASLNQQITAAKSKSQQPPNDLMDQRDQMIAQLAQHVGVNTVTQGDGSVNVYIGNGQPLVVGTSAATLAAGTDQFNSGEQRLYISNANGRTDVTGALAGGTVGGLLQFQEQMLTPAHNALGQAAIALTSLVNSQNRAGLDQNGAPGAALLGVGAPVVLASSANTGGATVAASVTASQTGNPADLGSLATSNYFLKYDGSQWSLVDTASGAATALSASGAGPVTLTGAGLTLTVTGSAKAGDLYLVKPTAQAIAGLGLVTTDPAKVAAAAPLVTAAAATNTGTATIDDGRVPSMPAWVRANYTLRFTSATAFTITGSNGQSTAGNYTPGAPISYNGFTVTLSGTPAAGDSFTINDNATGSGDNRNALKLAGTLGSVVLSGGTQSLVASVNAFVGTLGLQTSQARDGATAQQSVLASAQSAQQGVMGVNLDEEAANLLRFEQAYQAAAQVIKVADTLFKSLIQAV